MALQSRLDVTFRTTVGVLALPLLLILVSLYVLVLALLRVPRSHIDRGYWWFAETSCRIGGTKLEVHGLENIRPGEAYVVVPNHESNWDPVALVAALNKLPARFIAKKQIIRIPIFGWALLRSGNVRVERTNTQGDVERIRKEMAERPLDVSILFYAEGTRSRDGALHAFKKGAFVTAIAYGLPILPVGHGGTYRIWQPLRFGIRSGPVVVNVGRPISVDGLTYDDRDKLRDQTFETVHELRSSARRRIRELGSDPGGID
jgi:1-acyl-sn-glycerol-3-phosphate acyltransferase